MGRSMVYFFRYFVWVIMVVVDTPAISSVHALSFGRVAG